MKHPLVLLLCLAALQITIFTVYQNSLEHGFNVYDDRSEVQSNPVLLEMRKKDLLEYVPKLDHVKTHLLPELSFIIDERMWGIEPYGYHTTNIILHGANAALLFWLLLLLCGSTPAAFIGAMLFAVHPVHVESVAWISSRKDLLYGFFMISGMIAYSWYILHRRQRRWLLVTAVCYVFGILSRGSAVVLPVLLLALEVLLGRKDLKVSLKEKLLFVAAGIAAVAVLLLSGVRLHQVGTSLEYGPAGHIILNLYALGRYLAAFFWPFPLSVMHPFPGPVGFPSVTDCILILLPLLPLALVFTKTLPTRGLLFFFIFFTVSAATKLPAVVPVESIFTERFAYLPFIAFYVSVAVILQKKVFAPENYKMIYAVVPCMLAGILLLGSAAHARVAIWSDDEKLYEDVLQKYPGHPLAMDHLAEIVFYRNQVPRAIALIDSVLLVQPRNAGLLCKKGRALMWLQNYHGAITVFDSCIALDPSLTYAFFNRAISYDRIGETQKGIADFTVCISQEPLRGQHYYYRSLLRLKIADTVAAASDKKAAERLGYSK